MAYENIKELISHGQLVFNLTIMQVVKIASLAECGIKVKVVSYNLTDKRLGNSLSSLNKQFNLVHVVFLRFALITLCYNHSHSETFWYPREYLQTLGTAPTSALARLPLPFVFSAFSSQVAATATEICQIYLQQFWLFLNFGFTPIWDKSALLWKKK